VGECDFAKAKDAICHAEDFADCTIERQSHLILSACIFEIGAAQRDIAKPLYAVRFSQHVPNLAVKRQRRFAKGARDAVVASIQRDFTEHANAIRLTASVARSTEAGGNLTQGRDRSESGKSMKICKSYGSMGQAIG